MLAGVFGGCRTVPESSPIDLSGPGWQVRQGQAIWRDKKESPEIAGEIVLATHANGAALIQFLKNPLPLLTGQITPQRWRMEFIPEKRTISGRGDPPPQLIWLQLLRALQGAKLPEPLQFGKTTEGAVQIENRRTGESVTLFLNE